MFGMSAERNEVERPPRIAQCGHAPEALRRSAHSALVRKLCNPRPELKPRGAERRRCCLNFSVLFQSVLLQPHKIKKQKEKSLNPRNSGINKIVHGRLPAKPEKTSVPDPPQAQKRSLSVFSEFIQRQRPRALPVRSVTYALVFHQPR